MKRRDLIKGQATHVPAPAALGALNNRWALAQSADFKDDLEVLNYALTLEYLEAAFYQQGNQAVQLQGVEKEYLQQVQVDEESHVETLTQTITKLGGTPVEAPGVDFGDAFDNREKYLTTSHTFENVGVGAYLGAAGFIKDKKLLQAAAGIFGVEARHAAIVGYLLELPVDDGVFMGATETPQTKQKVLDAVMPFLMPDAPETGAGGSSDERDAILAATGGALLAGAGAATYVHHRMKTKDAELPEQ